MSVTLERPPSGSRRPAPVSNKLLTVADLAAMPSELPSGPVRYELNNGKLVIMSPPGGDHSAVESNFVTQFKNQGEFAGHGKARSGGPGVILRRKPDRVVGPDALFYSNSRLPLRQSPEGYYETIPDLVVEVRSKNDRGTSVQRKVDEYFAAGVLVVWVPDQARQTVTEHRPGQPPKTFRVGDVLTVEDVIPGFRYPVADAFVL